LETHLAFLDYTNAFDRVKRDRLFEILQSKNSPNLLLTSIIEIYSGNKIKVKINSKLVEEHTIYHGIRQGCPLSPTLFNIYMNEIIVKRKQIYTKALLYQTVQK
jgi:retron-type reverse transcriptase